MKEIGRWKPNLRVCIHTYIYTYLCVSISSCQEIQRKFIFLYSMAPISVRKRHKVATTYIHQFRIIMLLVRKLGVTSHQHLQLKMSVKEWMKGLHFSYYLVKNGHKWRGFWDGSVVYIINSGVFNESPFCISGMHCVCTWKLLSVEGLIVQLQEFGILFCKDAYMLRLCRAYGLCCNYTATIVVQKQP